MIINKNKFRIWDKKYKMWADPHCWRLNAQGGVTWNKILSSPNGQEDFVIQQFTGLVDKNGKEIWEGDIVEQTAILSFCPPQITRHIVKWDNEYKYGWVVPLLGMSFIPEINEVIGNIFENPELLKK